MSAALPNEPVSGSTQPETPEGVGPGTPQPVPTPQIQPRQVSVFLNGEAQRVPADLNLESLLRYLGHQPRLVVVEYNGAILPRALWADQTVGESDVLEVVTIVGGGS
jgi:sulfur carrier protein